MLQRTAGATAILAQAPSVLAEIGTGINGDGTGVISGVNSYILGWLLLPAFGLVWVLYATAVKDIDILLNIDEVSSPCGGLIWVYDTSLPGGWAYLPPPCALLRSLPPPLPSLLPAHLLPFLRSFPNPPVQQAREASPVQQASSHILPHLSFPHTPPCTPPVQQVEERSPVHQAQLPTTSLATSINPVSILWGHSGLHPPSALPPPTQLQPPHQVLCIRRGHTSYPPLTLYTHTCAVGWSRNG